MTNLHRDILSTQKALAWQAVCAMGVGFSRTRETRNVGTAELGQRPCDG